MIFQRGLFAIDLRHIIAIHHDSRKLPAGLVITYTSGRTQYFSMGDVISGSLIAAWVKYQEGKHA